MAISPQSIIQSTLCFLVEDFADETFVKLFVRIPILESWHPGQFSSFRVLGLAIVGLFPVDKSGHKFGEYFCHSLVEFVHFQMLCVITVTVTTAS